jgi:hypothetical protein
MAGPGSDTPGLVRPELVRVLESAARLQEIVPDAVLVGGSAAALWANHRSSSDHDHVLADLSTRFDAVLEAIEATDGWVTNRYLIVRRNQVRDYLDVAALADRYGIAHAAGVLRHIDVYYSDQRGPESQDVATQLARQLADPRPADSRTIQQLDRYKGLDERWADWSNVVGVCRSLAVEMVQ